MKATDYVNKIIENYTKCFLELECMEDCKELRQYYFIDDLLDYPTYDSEIATDICRDVVDVLKVILDRKTFEYIKNPCDYKKYIMVCDKLNELNMIDWGTSIRGAWLNTCFELEGLQGEKLQFTKEILEKIIEWVE